nr:hypothetical protein CFP56_52191 [Quercus suber]
MRWRCLQMSIEESGKVDDLLSSQKSRINDMLGKTAGHVASTDWRLSVWSKFGLQWATLTRLAHLVRQQVSVQEYDMLLVSLFRRTLNDLRKRMFTYPSDSLPAIAGLARHMEESLEGRGHYYAGL